ncbi:ABC transporter G family member 23-like [Lycorma delicatula]|uniref:ABC transporter G family member 23-like n=1 Tax=Lycorma delicatula TaxID=130591 RepID=UPI003F518DDA
MENTSLETEVIKSEESEIEPLILVRNAYKRYSPTVVVLRGLNMNVSKGSIYGLLGPSGCGKTTLLNCLIGRRSLDTGTIQINLESKLQVGYMPQEISLYDGLSMSEVFMYFGLLMNRSKEYIQNREKEFIEFLELPPSERIIATLSGGQQRRVSMAVALFHDPELLVFDEPTVGVDPLLCHNIWKYFLKITKEECKTIIITTHYIEEAKNSHMIGLMRNGVILAEMSPLGLMTSLNCSTLEEAFLQLSQKQEDHQVETEDYPERNTEKSDIPFKSGSIFALYRFKAQLFKNIAWTKRNIPITLFMLLLPSVVFILFMSTMGGNIDHVPLATVRDELSHGIDDCNITNKIVSPYGCVTDIRFSCKFISFLRNKSYEVIEYETVEEGVNAVKKNKAWALLHFPKNYTEALLERLDRGSSAKNETIDSSTVEIHMDNTIYFVTLGLRRNLVVGFVNCMQQVLRNCGINEKVIKLPMRVNPPVYDSYDIRYAPLSGYIISNILRGKLRLEMSIVVDGRLSDISEKTAHCTLNEKFLYQGLTGLEMVIAHFCIQSIIAVCQNMLVFIIVYGVFNIKTNGNKLLSLCIFFLAEYCGMTLGFLVVEFTSLERFVMYIGVSLIIFLFFSIGMIWPVEGMHRILKKMNAVNPINKAVLAYNSLQFRDLPFTNPLIYEGYLYLFLCIILLSFSVAMKMRNN